MDSDKRTDLIFKATEEGQLGVSRAVLDAPGELSGVSPELRSGIERELLQHEHAEPLQQEKALEEAAADAERALDAVERLVQGKPTGTLRDVQEALRSEVDAPKTAKG